MKARSAHEREAGQKESTLTHSLNYGTNIRTMEMKAKRMMMSRTLERIYHGSIEQRPPLGMTHITLPSVSVIPPPMEGVV